VLRVHVDERLGEAVAREVESLEPEPLDLVLAFEMVGEEVAGDPNLVIRYVEALTQ